VFTFFAAVRRALARRAHRVRTPIIRQAQAVDCGPTSLAIVLAFHGCSVSVERLRVLCGLSRDGTTAWDLVQAARLFGLTPAAFGLPPDRLESASFPCIASWSRQHFVVLEGCTAASVFVNDPATGPRTISRADFAREYQGALLTFAKSETFAPVDLTASIGREIRTLMRAHRASIAFVIVASLTLVMTSATTPMFAQVYIDRVLAALDPLPIGLLLIALLVITIAGGLASYLQQDVLIRVDARLSLSRGREVLASVLRLPLEVITRRTTGDLATCLDSSDRLGAFLSKTVLKYSVDVLLVVTFASLMLLYSPLLALAVAACGGLNALLLRYASRNMTARQSDALAKRGHVDGLSASYLRSIETIKANGAESRYFDVWAGLHAASINARQDLAAASVWIGTIAPFFSALTGVAVVVIGGHQIADGVMTVGMLVAFQALMHNIQGPLTQVISLQGDLRMATADLIRLTDVTTSPRAADLGERARFRIAAPGAAATPDAVSDNLPDGLLVVQRVTYGFSRTKRPFITGCDLTVGWGRRVALVGKSGSGKSTVARLAGGLYEPWSGCVALAGRPRTDVSSDVWTSAVAIVDNTSFFFQGTVRDNLAFWDRELSDETLMTACRDAEIDACVEAMGGLDAMLAERGTNLSGGQRQRLEIARALARAPALLILDEATSAIDAPCERRILRHIARRGCACLVITHRLSAIQDCDEILVMEKGQIVERGTHEALLEAQGTYDVLHAARSAAWT